ncbi:non-ribosomal peptide synthetase [Streptomyces graminilatus]|uniref:non-ribosomal peptide synthetase n=1 Tax=Streptomyces graminilatus TaxID=1464070 RepID=UPI0006E35455|nr:non-ribosomal peptide synthetase [Streptomyces graminilatus]
MSQTAERRAAIAKWLAQRAEATAQDPTVTSANTGRISLGQRGLWFQSGLGESENTGSAFCYRLRGTLHHQSLAQAFEAVIARHEPLRTRYVYERDEPVMVTDPPAPVALDVVRAEAPTGDDGVNWLIPAIQEYASRPFDLGADAALRLRLWRIGDDDHVLAFVVHHIAFDGWSLGVFQNEISHFYDHFLHGAPVTLPELTTSYSSFAEEQRRSVDEGRFAEHTAYWKDQLRSAPPLLDLPTDHPRPVVQSFKGDLHSSAVSPESCVGIGMTVEQEGASLAMALLAGYALFLGRWSRKDEVVVGLPVANRAKAELEPLIGMFVNLLPIRVRLDPDLTFRELLRQVRTTMLAAFDHQALPFDQIVQEHRRADEDQWSTPIVNTALALQTADRGKLVFGEASVEALMVHERTSIFDLTLTMAPVGDGFAGYLEYNRELFEAGTISRMNEALATVYAYCAGHPDLPLSGLSLAGADPAPRPSGETAPTATADAGSGRGLLDRFLSTERTTPERAAVTDRQGGLTYAELRAAVEASAVRLKDAGVVPGSVVGVHLPRGRDLLITFLAVLWTGGVYLPLDPVHPVRRLSELVEDSGASHIVTDAVGDLPWSTGPVVVRPGAEPGTGTGPHEVDGSAPAYLIYTSGSTGRPKGVTVSRANLDHLVVAQDALPVDGSESFAAVATPSFDASVWEMALPLGRQGRLDFCAPETLAEDLTEFGTQVLTSTPSLLGTIGQVPPTLKVIVSAGEALPTALARTLERSVCLVNAYGPTETTVCASFSTSARDQDTRSIGTALPGVELHVLDENLREVPLGAVGEICVGGAGVALGYHGDEVLTKARFVSSAVRPGDRVYRTGDLGRRGTDGCLYYLGRADDQIKLNGQRVQLADIEAAAAQAAGVVSAAAYVSRTPAGTHLGLAVTAAAGTADPAGLVTEVERACAERLPSGVVPTRIWVTSGLPLTPSGKADRTALAATEPAAPAGAPDTAQPRTPLEAEIADIWAEVLDTPVNDLTSTLYSLGGQSLQAVRIISEIRKKFGIRIAVRDFLSAPTVAALAERLGKELNQ